jgi:hypothetical protein
MRLCCFFFNVAAKVWDLSGFHPNLKAFFAQKGAKWQQTYGLCLVQRYLDAHAAGCIIPCLIHRDNT